MDLGTVKQRLDDGDYESVEAWAEDIRLVWSNAMTFNLPGDDVHECAKALATSFDRMLKQFPKIAGAPGGPPGPSGAALHGGGGRQVLELKRNMERLQQEVASLRSKPQPAAPAAGGAAAGPVKKKGGGGGGRKVMDFEFKQELSLKINKLDGDKMHKVGSRKGGERGALLGGLRVCGVCVSVGNHQEQPGPVPDAVFTQPHGSHRRCGPPAKPTRPTHAHPSVEQRSRPCGVGTLCQRRGPSVTGSRLSALFPHLAAIAVTARTPASPCWQLCSTHARACQQRGSRPGGLAHLRRGGRASGTQAASVRTRRTGDAQAAGRRGRAVRWACAPADLCAHSCGCAMRGWTAAAMAWRALCEGGAWRGAGAGSQVVEILRRRKGHMMQQDDEVEIDMNALDKQTLRELDKYVNQCLNPPSARKGPRAPAAAGGAAAAAAAGKATEHHSGRGRVREMGGA